MALKGPRITVETDPTYTCNVPVLRGVLLTIQTSGSGVAQGDSAGVATQTTNPSGLIPAGLLLGDVVVIDETHYHRNFQKDEVPVGYRVNLLKIGRVTTDQIVGSPTAGNAAYMVGSGQMSPTLSATGGLVATPKVGRFVGSVDSAGFATVDIMLPQI
jgi:hypothetical protein